MFVCSSLCSRGNQQREDFAVCGRLGSRPRGPTRARRVGGKASGVHNEFAVQLSLPTRGGVTPARVSGGVVGKKCAWMTCRVVLQSPAVTLQAFALEISPTS